VELCGAAGPIDWPVGGPDASAEHAWRGDPAEDHNLMQDGVAPTEHEAIVSRMKAELLDWRATTQHYRPEKECPW
jgi:hypothetical protein